MQTIHSPPIFVIKYAMNQFYSCPHVFPDPLPLAGHCVTHLFGNNVFRQRLGWKSVQKLPKLILFGKTIYTVQYIYYIYMIYFISTHIHIYTVYVDVSIFCNLKTKIPTSVEEFRRYIPSSEELQELTGPVQEEPSR